jgi:hypothetical protein
MGGRGSRGSEGPGGGSRGRDGRERITSRRGPRTVKNIKSDYNKVLLKDNTNLATYKKFLVVWAHDDTVEPEKKYRYRMRIGVFNPTAGKGWFHGPDKDQADRVILWSNYTDVTEEISIDPMTYFFPINVARDKQSVSIQVSKFDMGNWQSHEFDVMAGELIGHSVEVKEESKADKKRKIEMDFVDEYDEYDKPKEPEIVDFGTGALLVDIVEVSDWVGDASLRPRKYSDVLYSLDGSNIERLPTKKSNWPKNLQNKFDKIRLAQETDIKLLSKGSGGYQNYNMGPGIGEYDMMGPGGGRPGPGGRPGGRPGGP